MSASAQQVRSRKITLTLPEALLNRLDERVSPRQRSDFIIEAIEERLAVEEQLAALDDASGAWIDEHHPEMVTPQDIDNWLAELRGTWERNVEDDKIAP